MKFFNFSNDKKNPPQLKNIVPDHIDKSCWRGKDFYFLITGGLYLPAEEYDRIMTPNSFKWERISSVWPFYKVDEDEFGFFQESDVIQLEFNDGISYQKARKIAEEIIENINAISQTAGLLVAGKPRIYLSSETTS